MSTPTATPEEKPFHYFGSTAYHWVVGETRQEVLNELSRMAGADLIKRHVKEHGGLYCWTCRVDAPRSAKYDIAWFQPSGVAVSQGLHFNIMNTKGHVTTVEPKEPQS
jgi:hypothetical protein